VVFRGLYTPSLAITEKRSATNTGVAMS